MAERMLQAVRRDEDQGETSLRPQTLAEFIGQAKVCANLKVFIDAARGRREALDHVLFAGPPGLGKTTLAQIVARELGVNFRATSGAVIAKAGDLAALLTNLENRDVLFIDEIHRLNPAVEEILYPAMEDFQLDLIIGEGPAARSVKIDLSKFTLVAATTRLGLLTTPLRDRFHTREHLGFYTIEELTEIVRRSAKKLLVNLADDAALEIARRSRATPRIANNRLRWVRDYADSKAGGRATLDVTNSALAMAGIDDLGLDKQDRSYLETIIRVFSGGPVGLEAIAHTMNLSPDTLADEVEPFLLRSELLVRTPRGRVVTAKSYEHLQLPPPADSSPQGTLFA